MRRARTWGWGRTRRYDGPSKDLGPSSPYQSCPDCIIATRGYDFREGQASISRWTWARPAWRAEEELTEKWVQAFKAMARDPRNYEIRAINSDLELEFQVRGKKPPYALYQRSQILTHHVPPHAGIHALKMRVKSKMCMIGHRAAGRSRTASLSISAQGPRSTYVRGGVFPYPRSHAVGATIPDQARRL
jgi:hypothetical protein